LHSTGVKRNRALKESLDNTRHGRREANKNHAHKLLVLSSLCHDSLLLSSAQVHGPRKHSAMLPMCNIFVSIQQLTVNTTFHSHSQTVSENWWGLTQKCSGFLNRNWFDTFKRKPMRTLVQPQPPNSSKMYWIVKILHAYQRSHPISMPQQDDRIYRIRPPSQVVDEVRSHKQVDSHTSAHLEVQLAFGGWGLGVGGPHHSSDIHIQIHIHIHIHISTPHSQCLHQPSIASMGSCSSSAPSHSCTSRPHRRTIDTGRLLPCQSRNA
jgi:hypothetical protein